MAEEGEFTSLSSIMSTAELGNLSIDELKGLILVDLTWYQYFNAYRFDHAHEILTDEHKNRPIVNNTEVLKLVAIPTGNFIPTPSANQIVFNAHRSLNIFCIRVCKSISKSTYRKLIEQGAEEARSAGLPSWRSRVLIHSDVILK